MEERDLQRRITQAVDRALDWITCRMLVVPDGSKGVYERVRIDLNELTTWVRPDCNTEVCRVLALYNKTVDAQYLQLYENILNWVLQTQDTNMSSELYGSFPFYITAPRDGGKAFTEEFRWANDNGKIISAFVDLYNLLGDKALLDAALKGTVYWKKNQVNDGTFKPEILKGVCFTAWMCNAFLQCHQATRDESLIPTIKKGIDWILSKQLNSGRFLTSFETANIENWRPVSSEQAIAVYLLSRASVMFDSCYSDEFEIALEYLLSLQHESGAILNCREDAS
jgi:squalene cyclase